VTEEKLKNTVTVFKLSTGEEIIGMALDMDQNMALVALPYIIVKKMVPSTFGQMVEAPVMEKYFPYVQNRYFPIPHENMLFAKDAKDSYAQNYIQNVKNTESEEFAALLKEHAEREKTSSLPNPEITSNYGEVRIRLDNDLRVIHSGNTTRH